MTVIVTGGRSGLGKKILDYYRTTSRKTYSISLDSSQTSATEKIKNENHEVIIINKLCDELFDELFQNISVGWSDQILVINNLNIHINKDLQDMSLSEWELSLMTGVTASFLTSKYSRKYVSSPKTITFINISSISSIENLYRGISYGASKAALNKFTMDFANTCRDRDIRVTNLILGAININSKEDWKMDAEEIANTINFIEQLPSHVNVESIVLRPNNWPK